ncbi:MAG: PQQ-binding-like beta-propeller repeat protein [Chloroflexota bacterium]
MKRKFLIIITIFILASLLSGCGGAPAASSWPGIVYDPQSQTIYTAFQSHIFAIQSSGSMKWRYPEKADTNQQFYSSPVLTTDGQLVASSYENKVYSLNPANGQLNKILLNKDRGRFIDSPLATQDSLYASSSDEFLYAFDLQGTLRWTFPDQTKDKQADREKQALWAKPAEKDGTLYLPSMNRKIYALSAKDGSVIWKQDLPSASVHSPVLSEDGVLYAGTLANEIVALDTKSNGKLLWSLATKGWVWSAPAIVDKILYFGDLTGSFYAVDRTNGNILPWADKPDGINVGSPISGTPLVLKDKIYFTTQAGNLYVLDMKGNILKTSAVGGKVYGGAVAAGDQILVAPVGIDNILIAFDLDGNQKWSFAPPK